MALLGMDASTFTMVLKPAKSTSASGVFVPVQPEELEKVKVLLEEQLAQCKKGDFAGTKQAEVSNYK